MDLQTKLISLRKQKGLTQLDLAERLDVSRQAISRWEVGAAVPSTDNLKTLSELYGLSLDYLLNDEDLPCKDTDSKEQENITESRKDWKIRIGIIFLVALIVLSTVYKMSIRSRESEQITPIGDMTIVEDEYTTYTFSIE